MLPVQFVLYGELERRNQLRLTREESRFLRDRSDPFGLTDRRFVEIFRLSKELVRFLFDELQELMEDGVRASRIHYQQRILVGLRFYAIGSYQRAVGQEYLVAVSQPMVSRCIEEVATVIVQHFGNEWIKFPTDAQEVVRKKREFFESCGIPGTIGAIDCTHIRIISPKAEEHAYMNRKGYHSMNVQLICDTNLFIVNVNSSFPGSCHDSYIWQQSVIQTYLQNSYRNGDRNTWLLGDSGYPQQPWLMTPVPGAQPNSPEERFNQAHASGRNHIERTNGVLKSRFRCIMGERELRYEPPKVCILVNACCILHNMCIRSRVPLLEIIEGNEQNDNNHEVLDLPIDNGGRQTRTTLINRYFQ
uniref:Putative nuclease HARBI1 n=1 Tax=Diabrotica virgifera virgifera TaxID=50390 RepID=A0A6P7GR91_DIAVI